MSRDLLNEMFAIAGVAPDYMREEDTGTGGPTPGDAHPGEKMVFGTWRKTHLTPAEHDAAFQHHYGKSLQHMQAGLLHAYKASDASHRHAQSGYTDPESHQEAQRHEEMAGKHFAVADAHDHIRMTHSAIAAGARQAGIGDDETVDGSNFKKVLAKQPHLRNHISQGWDPKRVSAKGGPVKKPWSGSMSSGVSADGAVFGPENNAQAFAHPTHANTGRNTAFGHSLSGFHMLRAGHAADVNHSWQHPYLKGVEGAGDETVS